MASIESNLETIKTAVYGKDMRQAIYESISELHSGAGSRTDEILNKIDSSSSMISTDVVSYGSEIERRLETHDMNVINGINSIDQNLFNDYLDIKAKLNDIDNSTSSISTDVVSYGSEIERRLETHDMNVINGINSIDQNLFNDYLDIKAKLGKSNFSIEDRIEDVREEFRGKYDELMYEMKKSEKMILQEIKSLADELAVGNGTIAGQSTLITQGAISQSYAGTITRGDS